MLELLHDNADGLQRTDLRGEEVWSVRRILRWVDAEKINKDLRWFTNIGHAHMIEYGHLQMLRAAVQYYESSLTCGNESEEILPVLTFLGSALLSVYYIAGRKDDLNTSVDVGRKAVALTLEDHPDMAIYADNLGNGLQCRFERTGSMDDLNESIELGRKSVALTSDDHPNMATYANSLGNGLRRRFERTGSMDDLNESIELGRKAVALTPMIIRTWQCMPTTSGTDCKAGSSGRGQWTISTNRSRSRGK